MFVSQHGDDTFTLPRLAQENDRRGRFNEDQAEKAKISKVLCSKLTRLQSRTVRTSGKDAATRYSCWNRSAWSHLCVLCVWTGCTCLGLCVCRSATLQPEVGSGVKRRLSKLSGAPQERSYRKLVQQHAEFFGLKTKGGLNGLVSCVEGGPVLNTFIAFRPDLAATIFEDNRVIIVLGCDGMEIDPHNHVEVFSGAVHAMHVSCVVLRCRGVLRCVMYLKRFVCCVYLQPHYPRADYPKRISSCWDWLERPRPGKQSTSSRKTDRDF